MSYCNERNPGMSKGSYPSIPRDYSFSIHTNVNRPRTITTPVLENEVAAINWARRNFPGDWEVVRVVKLPHSRLN